MKKIMILGGSKTQMPLYKAAKNEGYFVIMCDYNEMCQSREYADAFYNCSIDDKDRILSIAKKEKIDGIISNSERAMNAVAYVSEKLNLRGSTEKSISQFNSKSKFRDLQKRVGVFAPDSYSISSISELGSMIDSFPYPIIIKPSESSGTRGTTVVRNKNDIQTIVDAYYQCSNFSRNNMVTIEEYIEMPSLTVIEGDIFVLEDTFIWDGLFFTTRSKYAPMVPMLYRFPFDIENSKFETIKLAIQKLFFGAGINFGQYNLEMYFDNKDRLFVIEINVRQGGFRIPQIICDHCGIDYYKLLVTTCVKEDAYFDSLKFLKRTKNNNAQYVVFSRTNGVYDGLYIKEEAKKYITNVDIIKKQGDLVKKCSNTDDAIGFVKMNFISKEEQSKILEKIEEYIKPIIKETKL